MNKTRNLGQRLKKAMKRRGLKQKDIVTATGYKQPVISRIMNGVEDVTMGRLLPIARALEVNIHWLATGEGEMFATPGTHGLITNTRATGVRITTTGDKNTYDLKSNIQLVKESHDSSSAALTPGQWSDLIEKIDELSESDQETVISLVDVLHKKTHPD